MKYVIHSDDGETHVFPLDNVEVVEVDSRNIEEFEALVDDNASYAELMALAEKPLVPDWRDGIEHVYDVKLAVAIGLNFDEPPTEDELRKAMLENVLDKIHSAWFATDVDLDEDISYELLAVENTEPHKEDNDA